jgi:hypothetical protein
MKWIFSLRYADDADQPPVAGRERVAVVGMANAATAEAAFRLARVPEDAALFLRKLPVVRHFVEDRLDAGRTGYFESGRLGSVWWCICIGPVHEVLS